MVIHSEILENQRTHVEDIISYVAMDTSKVVVLYDSYLINRFLDLYDQPVPFDKNRAIRDLDIPDAKADYRKNTLVPRQTQVSLYSTSLLKALLWAGRDYAPVLKKAQ